MNWEDTATGHHCNRHGEDFARGEVCRKCIVDPGPPPTIETEHAVDLEALAIEREVLNFSKFAKRTSEEYAARGTEKEANTGAKWGDVYLKSLRLWSELRAPRIEREHDDKLCEHDRAMSGVRGPN